jgi:hypothetical protein
MSVLGRAAVETNHAKAEWKGQLGRLCKAGGWGHPQGDVYARIGDTSPPGLHSTARIVMGEAYGTPPGSDPG